MIFYTFVCQKKFEIWYTACSMREEILYKERRKASVPYVENQQKSPRLSFPEKEEEEKEMRGGGAGACRAYVHARGVFFH